jgi:hypothetical protein
LKKEKSSPSSIRTLLNRCESSLLEKAKALQTLDFAKPDGNLQPITETADVRIGNGAVGIGNGPWMRRMLRTAILLMFILPVGLGIGKAAIAGEAPAVPFFSPKKTHTESAEHTQPAEPETEEVLLSEIAEAATGHPHVEADVKATSEGAASAEIESAADAEDHGGTEAATEADTDEFVENPNAYLTDALESVETQISVQALNEAMSEDGTFRFSVAQGPMQLDDQPMPLIVHLERRAGEEASNEQVAHALVFWSNPTGQSVSIPLYHVEGDHWATLVDPVLTSGRHQLRLAVMLESKTQQLERLVEMEYDLDLPALRLQQQFEHELGASGSKSAKGENEAVSAAAGLSWLGGIGLFIGLNLLAVLVLAGTALGIRRLPAEIRHRLASAAAAIGSGRIVRSRKGSTAAGQSDSASLEPFDAMDEVSEALKNEHGGKDHLDQTELLIQELQGTNLEESQVSMDRTSTNPTRADEKETIAVGGGAVGGGNVDSKLDLNNLTF